jgi:O-acetyl-ADP-ribose deacetylase (regulator of RNase III)
LNREKEKAMTEIFIEQGDITSYRVDAVVNAANNELILGGGLAGVIARKGGPEIQKECDRHGPIKIGQAAITTAGNLPARYVIHAASMSLGEQTTEDALARCVRDSLRLAGEYRLQSIAFPAIGTGIAGFSLKRCAQIMLPILLEKWEEKTILEKIFIVLFDLPAYNIFVSTYEDLTKNKPLSRI